MKIFFAGATGVIGKELLPLLVESGHEVTAATRKREEIPSIEDHGAEAVVCDALDTESMLSVVAEVRAECVLHELTNLPDAFDPERLDEQLAANNRVRTEGTRNLAKAAEAAGAKKIVAQSLAFGYAPEGSWVKAEEAPLFTDATEPWGASVRAVEALEQAVLEAEVPERVVLRYGHLYGPGTMYAPDGQMGQGVSAGAVPLIGDGDGTFSFIHLSDLASATVAAIEGWTSGLYNVCDDDPALTREWLPRYAEALGAEKPPTATVEDALEAAGWLTVHQMTEMRGASNQRARNAGWEPLHRSWREGFAKILS